MRKKKEDGNTDKRKEKSVSWGEIRPINQKYLTADQIPNSVGVESVY